MSSEDHLGGRVGIELDSLGFLLRSLAKQLSDAHRYSVIAMGSRPRVLIPPTSDRTQLTTRISQRELGSLGGSAQLLAALRLASLTAKGSPRGRIVVFVASEADLLDSEREPLATRLADARLAVDFIVLSSGVEGSSDAQVASLSEFVSLVNAKTEARTAGLPTGPESVPLSRVVTLTPRDTEEETHQDLQRVLAIPEAALEEPLAETAPAAAAPAAAPTAAARKARANEASSSGRIPSVRGGFIFNHATSCRYDSLDSLMHLSYDGFMRPWLPSYGNVKKFLGPGGVSSWGQPGSQRMCYLSVYRVEVPKYEVLLEVRAGMMSEGAAPAPAVPSVPTPDNSEPATPAASAASSKEPSMKDISAKDAARGVMLHPDARKGLLQLVLPTDGSSVLRLRWTPLEKAPKPAAAPAPAPEAASSSDRKFTNLFERPEPAAPAPKETPNEPEWDIKLPHVHIAFKAVDGEANRVLMVELAEPCSRTHKGKRRWVFYLQQDWQENKRVGASGIASKLRQLHAVPPLVSVHRKEEMKPTGQPLQLGPLPLDLVESIMKGRGDTHQLVRQLHKLILQRGGDLFGDDGEWLLEDDVLPLLALSELTFVSDRGKQLHFKPLLGGGAGARNGAPAGAALANANAAAPAVGAPSAAAAAGPGKVGASGAVPLAAAPAVAAPAPAPAASSGWSSWSESLFSGLGIAPRQQCGKCRRVAQPAERFHVCGDCRKTPYCGPECQGQDWKAHRLLCYNPSGFDHRDDDIRALLASADRPRRVGQKPQAMPSGRPVPALVDPASAPADLPAAAAATAGPGPSTAATTPTDAPAPSAAEPSTAAAPLAPSGAAEPATPERPEAPSAAGHPSLPDAGGRRWAESASLADPTGPAERSASAIDERPQSAASGPNPRLVTPIAQALADSFRRKLSVTGTAKGCMSEVKAFPSLTREGKAQGTSTDDERVGSSSQATSARAIKSPRQGAMKDDKPKAPTTTTTVEVSTAEGSEGPSRAVTASGNPAAESSHPGPLVVGDSSATAGPGDGGRGVADRTLE